MPADARPKICISPSCLLHLVSISATTRAFPTHDCLAEAFPSTASNSWVRNDTRHRIIECLRAVLYDKGLCSALLILLTSQGMVPRSGKPWLNKHQGQSSQQSTLPVRRIVAPRKITLGSARAWSSLCLGSLLQLLRHTLPLLVL